MFLLLAGHAVLLCQIGFDSPGMHVSFDQCPAQLLSNTAQPDIDTTQNDSQQVTCSVVTVESSTSKAQLGVHMQCSCACNTLVELEMHMHDSNELRVLWQVLLLPDASSDEAAEELLEWFKQEACTAPQPQSSRHALSLF